MSPNSNKMMMVMMLYNVTFMSHHKQIRYTVNNLGCIQDSSLVDELALLKMSLKLLVVLRCGGKG